MTIQEKHALVKAIGEFSLAADNLNYLMQAVLGDGASEDDTQFHKMIQGEFPFSGCFSDISSNINKWHTKAINFKLKRTEIIEDRGWDRYVWLEKTNGQITGINMRHGVDYKSDAREEFEEQYSCNGERMTLYYDIALEHQVFHEVEDDQERMQKILSLYFMTTCEVVPQWRNAELLNDI